jgi:predicted component of type VI protein secretion system
MLPWTNDDVWRWPSERVSKAKKCRDSRQTKAREQHLLLTMQENDKLRETSRAKIIPLCALRAAILSAMEPPPTLSSLLLLFLLPPIPLLPAAAKPLVRETELLVVVDCGKGILSP